MSNTTLTQTQDYRGYNSNSSSNFLKYNGLLKQKVSKTIRNLIFSLLHHVDVVVPPYHMMLEVVTLFRAFQIILPCMYSQFNSVFENGALGQKIANVLSVFYMILPPQLHYQYGLVFLSIYIILIFIYLINIVVIAFWFQKYAETPKIALFFFYIFNSIFICLMPAIGIGLAAESITRYAIGTQFYYPAPAELFVIVITILFTLIIFLFEKYVLSISVVFRPASFISVFGTPQVFLLLGTSLLQIVSGIGYQVGKIGEIVCLIIMILIYIGIACIPFYPGSFIKTWHNIICLAAALTGATHTIVVVGLSIKNIYLTEVAFFEITGEMLLYMIISTIIFNYRTRIHLVMLDQFESDIESKHFSRYGQFVSAVCSGMKYNHPSCLDWTVFKNGITFWADNVATWILFCKFAAIFPSETDLLQYVICNIRNRSFKGGIAKQAISQATSIMFGRENSLSQQLKFRITKLSKQVNSTKQKIRRIWDLVLQGNIGEMEQGMTNVYDNIMKSEVEFAHLLTIYPNNRFVTRQYSRFVLEVQADQKTYVQWTDKTRLLSRGFLVNQDKINNLGLAAYPNLPPPSFKHNLIASKNDISESIQSADPTDIEDDQFQSTIESYGFIRKEIEALKIPAITAMITITCLITFLFICVPIVAMLLIGKGYTSKMIIPLNFMYYVSFLRTLNVMIPLFSHRYILENLPTTGNPIFIKTDLNYSPISLGSTNSTKSQVKYLIGEAVVALNSLGSFQNFLSTDPSLSNINDMIFGSSLIEYEEYINISSKKFVNVSFQQTIADTIYYISNLLEFNVTSNTVNNSMLLNPFLNARKIALASSKVLELTTQYINKDASSSGRIVEISQIVISIFLIIVIPATLIIEVANTELQKQEIYNCLIVLPKNVVSQMSESLRLIMKDDGTQIKSDSSSSEMNRQEDNVMKILNNANDSSSMNIDKLSIAICQLVLLVCALIGINLTITIFTKIPSEIQINSPQLENVLSTSCFMASVLLNLNNAIGKMNNFAVGESTLLEMAELANGDIGLVTYYSQTSNYGGRNQSQSRYKGNRNEVDSRYGCMNESAISSKISDSYSCFTPEEQTYLFEPLTLQFIYKILFSNITHIANFNSDSELINQIWIMSMIKLYDLYYLPMFESIIDEISGVIHSIIPRLMVPGIIVIIIAIISELVIIKVMIYVQTKFKYALILLLHCPMTVISATPKVLEVLSGNFSKTDTTNRSVEFYNDLIINIPDAILIYNLQNQICLVNNAAERMFSVTREEIMYTSINEFLTCSKFLDDATSLLENRNSEIIVRYQDEDNFVYLVISSAVISENIVLTCRDNTQNILYQRLIVEEQAKSDKLLASILPTNLVTRVQSGEKNICFAVQTTTIVFLDIVGFTPWCASHDASFVMTVLNKFFNLLDVLVTKTATLSKIKCIGDCYMAAGGIFNEINIPNSHAREAVDFGLDSFEALEKVNQSVGTTLQIRVGVSSGGPIVAGVLGTDKPTFEILGPVINMAQQMEHHGVPMAVHVSRPVYELIYGGNFIVKERGEVKIKSGSVITYLISGRI